jgi:hypothetical protein
MIQCLQILYETFTSTIKNTNTATFMTVFIRNEICVMYVLLLSWIRARGENAYHVVLTFIVSRDGIVWATHSRQMHKKISNFTVITKETSVLSKHLCVHVSMALLSFFGPWPLFSFLILYIIGRTPWSGEQSVAKPLPTHRTTQTQNKRTYKHECLEWDSIPRSQRSSERRQFMPYTARPLWPASKHIV